MENSSDLGITQGNSPEINVPIVVSEKQVQEALDLINGKTAREIALMFAEQKESARVYRELAGTDHLTGLLNRRGLENEFARVKGILQRTVPEGGEGLTAYTILFLDLVGMKQVNDKFGQNEGDKFLTGTSAAITNTVRAGTDIAARVGGDEFVVVLPNTDVEGAAGVVGRIQEKMPSDRQFNVVIGTFGGAQTLDVSLEQVGEALKEAKMIAPKDETGRSLGFGVVYIGNSKQ